ncbi:MAG: GntR family transcriptional regulator [Sphingomonadales bacterium]|nr:GntR family transcriptional regulator [Sphingomonadales bacterium]
MAPSQQSLRYRTKEEQVADFLREGIIAGRYPRGARLKQQEIATLLSTSITPVREALKLLEAEGYVTGDSFRGATVAPFDLNASRETLNLRILLETQLVKEAAARADAAQIAELTEVAAQFAKAFAAGDNETARAANYQFHHRMFEFAKLPQTHHFVQILWARYPFDLINRLKGRVSRAAEEHDEMLAALIANDASAAMLATRKHIESGWLELQASVEAGA